MDCSEAGLFQAQCRGVCVCAEVRVFDSSDNLLCQHARLRKSKGQQPSAACQREAWCRASFQVKWEPAAPVGNTASAGLTGKGEDEPLFPHLYGTIDFDSVVAELPVERRSDGTFLYIAGL